MYCTKNIPFNVIENFHTEVIVWCLQGLIQAENIETAHLSFFPIVQCELTYVHKWGNLFTFDSILKIEQ